MKVLLVGEYSGVHTNLKKGLEKLGVDVLLISEGDVWKKFDSDIRLLYPEDTKWKKYYNQCMIQMCRMWAKDVDVVQFMNPSCLYIINKDFTKFAFELMGMAKTSVTVLAGCDGNMFDHFGKLMPDICRTCLKELRKRQGYCIFECDADYRRYEEQFYERVDCIVPGEWDCYTVYHDYVKKHNHKLTKIIPYPIDCEEICPSDKKGDKIMVHFPLNAAKKGTVVVEKAFQKLAKKYKKQVSFEVRGRMPIKDYLKYLDATDIIVDGVKGYSYGLGMSCLMAMAKETVAIGVREEETAEGRNAWLLDSPQVSSGEGVDGIVDAVERLINNPKELRRQQKASRAYVVKYHHATKVAKRYMELYKQLLNGVI